MWKIVIENEVLNGSLKKYKSDRRVMKGYRRALSDLARSDDPAAAGSRKRGRLQNYYSYSVTRSHRMIYGINYGKRVIRVIYLGDHKEVYDRT